MVTMKKRQKNGLMSNNLGVIPAKYAIHVSSMSVMITQRKHILPVKPQNSLLLSIPLESAEVGLYILIGLGEEVKYNPRAISIQKVKNSQ